MYNIPSSLKNKVCSATEAAQLVHDKMIVAASGYTSAGDPKETLMALAQQGKEGRVHNITLITAAQLSETVENALADSGVLERRVPFTVSRSIREKANNQDIHYVEVPMSKMPRLTASGALGVPDIAVIEVMNVGEDGEIVLTTSVGISPLFCSMAKEVILEINTAQPEELYGIHDICNPCSHKELLYPEEVNTRTGSSVFKVDLAKVAAVVYSSHPDYITKPGEVSDQEKEICNNLQNFLECNFPGHILPPVQTGIGSLSRAVIRSFGTGRYQDLRFFCGALQADMFDLLECGKCSCMSGGSVELNDKVRRQIRDIGPELQDRLVLRGMEVSNGPAVAGLGIIALNTGIEIDMYGNVNASHVNGSKVINGIGGGAAFAANSRLSVILMPSVKKSGKISCFVPQTPHVDIVHHDVDVVISEYGIADLRGKDDLECAREIIRQCVHPDYIDLMEEELFEAMKAGGHHPVNLTSPFSWHERFNNNGSMDKK